MPSEENLLAEQGSAYSGSMIAVEARSVAVAPSRRIKPQHAIVLRDAGRALLALVAADTALEVAVPELPADMTALRDYHDDLFVAGCFDDTFQKQVATCPVPGDVRTLASHLKNIDEDVTLGQLEKITVAARLIESSTDNRALGRLAGGIACVVTELTETLQSRKSWR